MPAAQPAKPAHVVGFLPITTFVLWTGCVIVGVLGYALHYARPQPPVSAVPSVTAEKITVELDNSPPLIAAAPARPSEKLTTPPPAPSLAVAEPSAALAFPLPVSGLVNISDAQASVSGRIDTAAKNTAIQPLVFGQGAGRQPAPLYPSTSIRQGQEGTVSVRFNVAEDGRVLAAAVASSSPWPLLDEAALRAVREHWHFSPGAVRTYEVAIRFTLQK